MKRAVIIFFLYGIIINSTPGQEVSVRAAFDTSRIFIGDQVNYTLTVEKPVSFLLDLPVFKDSLIKNIEIIKGPVSDTTLLKDGRLRITSKYLVTSFDSGFYQVPPVFAELKTDNTIKRFYSDYAHLEVARVNIAPPDTASMIFDIVQPYRAPVTLGEIIPWILILIVASAAAWYIYRLIRKIRRGRAAPEPVVNPDPAYIIAFRQLELLREEKLWQKGAVKEYYSRLTEIIRQYLENRFGISSLELTTPETLDELKRSGFRDEDSYGKLKKILTGADLVKFAKYNSASPENDQNFEYAWDFVSATRYAGEDNSTGDNAVDNAVKNFAV